MTIKKKLNERTLQQEYEKKEKPKLLRLGKMELPGVYEISGRVVIITFYKSKSFTKLLSYSSTCRLGRSMFGTSKFGPKCGLRHQARCKSLLRHYLK